jgi:hypothetical protein
MQPETLASKPQHFYPNPTSSDLFARLLPTFKRELSNRKRLYTQDYPVSTPIIYSTPFTAMLTQLCATCRQFAVGESEGSQYEKHYQTIAAFYEAKTYGCSISTRL